MPEGDFDFGEGAAARETFLAFRGGGVGGSSTAGNRIMIQKLIYEVQ